MSNFTYRVKVVDDLIDLEGAINSLAAEGFYLHQLVPLPPNTSGHTWIIVGMRLDD